MNLWIDDLRLPPLGWDRWAKSSAEAIAILDELRIGGDTYANVSFDHDLGMVDGEDDTTRRVMTWIIENEFFPTESARIHTANPVGRQWLSGTARRYMPDSVTVVG